MATVIDLDQREIARREEWEEMEFSAAQEEKRRVHELRVLKQKLKYTTRWRSILRIVLGVCSVLPKALVVVGIVFLTAIARPVPNSLYEYLAS